jgi:hypothetical protein
MFTSIHVYLLFVARIFKAREFAAKAEEYFDGTTGMIPFLPIPFL